MPFPPLAYFCVRALAKFADRLSVDRPIQCPLNDLVDEHDEHDPCLWATIAQLVHPLPPHFHDIALPLFHPHLPLLQRVSDTPNFSLITLLSLPNCNQLRDDSISQIASLNHLVALDLRGTTISTHALAVLTRALSPSTRTGIWGLRLLSLHSCSRIDNDVLAVLQRFPLLSAIDLRFTNCSPALIRAQLAPLGFHPSENKSLFHPATLFLGLCALENIANSASPPIPLYSSPPSVFRIHIDTLYQPSHRPKRTARVYPPDTIRTMSFAGDAGTVTFIPPIRKSVNKRKSPPSSSSIPSKDNFMLTRHNTASSPLGQPITVDDPINATPDSVQRFSPRMSSLESRRHSRDTELAPRATGYQDEGPPSPSCLLGHADQTPSQSTDQVTCPRLFCDVSSFYKSAQSSRSHRRILPLSAQAVHSFEDGRLEPLAIARPPPPWGAWESCEHQSSCPKVQFNDSQRTQPVVGWTARFLDEPIKVDRGRLHKRGSTAVAELVNRLTTKRPKFESEFARAKAQERPPVKPRNPFTRSTKSVFAERTAVSEQSRSLTPSVGAEPENVPQVSSLDSTRSREDNGLGKSLRPITTLKPPILPKELCVPLAKPPQPKAELRQTRLAFARDVSGGSQSSDV